MRVRGEQFPAHSNIYGGGWEGLPGPAWWPPKVYLEGEHFGLWWGKAPSPAFHRERVLCAPGPAATSWGMLSLWGNGLLLWLAEANTQPDGNFTPQLFLTALRPTAVQGRVYR